MDASPGVADRLNNVENVYVQNAEEGAWTVTVSGYNTPEGPQPYALVVDGVVISVPPPTPTPTPPADTDPPSVTDIIPDGSESLTVGTAYDITWSASDNVGVTSVDLAYSNDGGATFASPFASGEFKDGIYTYTWTVPDDARDNALIRVRAYDAAGNMGKRVSAAFSIVDSGGGSPTGTITITKANYNSRKNGGTLDIQATSSEGASPILTATYSPGGSPVNMTYNSKKDKWSKKITGVSKKPSSVRVCFTGTLNCDDETGIGGK